MKWAFKIGVLLIAISSYGQDTLRQQNTSMYPKYFVLYDNQVFEYRYSHCTAITVGRGHYEKKFGKLIFNFDLSDSLRFTHSFVKCDTSLRPFQMRVLDASDSSDLEFGYQVTKLDSNRFGIASLGYESIVLDKRELACHSHCVYLAPISLEEAYTGDERIVLKKVGLNYREKSVVYDMVEDEPWKKKKRTVKHFYKFE